MTQDDFGAGARVTAKPEFLCVETLSGFGSWQVDHRGRRIMLASDTSNDNLGNAIKDSLAASRCVVPYMAEGLPAEVEVDPDLYDYKLIMARYTASNEQFISRFGFGSRRALFKGMRKCHVEVKNSQMLIRPMAQEKLELWTQSKELAKQNVVISASAEPVVIGEALKLALSRCI